MDWLDVLVDDHIPMCLWTGKKEDLMWGGMFERGAWRELEEGNEGKYDLVTFSTSMKFSKN